MKLNPDKIKPDEAFSNHAVQGFSSEECPLNPKKSCFAIATGFGGAIINRCESLTDDGECKKT
jgi:hypothetical protein